MTGQDPNGEPSKTPIDAPAEGLERLAEAANAEHHAFEATQRAALQHAIAAGEALLEARRHIPHGGWLRWVKKHCDFTERTARRYMQLARNRSRVSDLDLDSVRDALAFLASEADPVEKGLVPAEFTVSALGLGPSTRRSHDPDPVRGLFAWMVPWECDCPHCGLVRVTPKPWREMLYDPPETDDPDRLL